MTEPTEEETTAELAAQRAARAAALAPLRDLGVGQDAPPAASLAETAAGLRAIQTNAELAPLWPHIHAAAIGLEALERFAGREVRELEAAGAFDPLEE